MLCEACQLSVQQTVAHHWFELPGMEYREKRICPRCNSLLATHRFYDRRFYAQHKDSLHHILPSWEEQLVIIREELRKSVERVSRVKDDSVFSDGLDADVLAFHMWYDAKTQEATEAGMGVGGTGDFVYKGCEVQLDPDGTCGDFFFKIGIRSALEAIGFLDDWLDNDRGSIW